MYSKFPFSMERIPRQTSFACFSLKFGSILSALLTILLSILNLAQCLATVSTISHHQSTWETVVTYGYTVIAIAAQLVTLFLTTLMLIGVLKERVELVKPWVVWTSVQVMVLILLFVLWSTMTMIDHFAGISLLGYVVEFLLLLIRVYMLMLVGSYHKQLEEEQEERWRTLVHDETWRV